jgi:predicted RNA-binding protein with PIN domain
MPYWLDGNNLIGQPAHVAQKDKETRKKFLTLLSQYSLSRRHQFVVFFDGDDYDRTKSPRGVLVRYSAPLSSDAAILEKLRGTKPPADIIVVTNDRELSNKCHNAGARTMDWAQFTFQMKPGLNLPSDKSPKTKEEKIQLEEWIDFFGLDKNNIG